MTVPIYAINSTGNIWSGKLINVTDPDNPISHDLTNFSKVYIVFTKPDGTRFPTVPQMESGYEQGAILDKSESLVNPDITFSNLTLPSILDQRGFWQYTPVALINNSLIKSPHTSGFWVV